MGGKSSKDEIDSSGQINNNIIIQDHVEVINQQVFYMFYVLCAVLVVNTMKLFHALYKDKIRGLKKSVLRKQNVFTVPMPAADAPDP